MIFSIKSFRRAAVSEESGQVTVWLSLCFLVFLTLYLVCLQSVQKQYLRQRAEQAVEAGMFSVFSEYETHLLEEYDLFCLDLSYGSGVQREDRACAHLWKYLTMQLEDVGGSLPAGLDLQGVQVQDCERLTDAQGAVFYRQAVRIMKERSGVSLAQDWLMQQEFLKEAENNAQRYEEDCEKYEGIVREYEDGEDGELEEEARQWDGLRKSFLCSMAVPGHQEISGKTVDLSQAPSVRELSVGSGQTEGTEGNLMEKQWFISYLCEYLRQAQEGLAAEEREGWLDYQMEYVLCGKASDQENLDQVILRILLLREGVNYVFLLTHPALSNQAQILASLLGVLTGNAEVIHALEQLILLSWAYGESVAELRQLLAGHELALWKTEEDWQVPLSGLLALIENPGKYDGQGGEQKGADYEDYLRMFLTLLPPEMLAMRTLDVIEGELQHMEGCGRIHLDHCVDRLTAQVWFEGVFLERTYGYE